MLQASHVQRTRAGAIGAAGKLRVAPFGPASSYLVDLLDNPEGMFGQMPPSGRLADEQVQQVISWIASGAPTGL